MIKLLRVDDRLLHGQVAFTWTRSLEADCILIANDDVVKNEFRKTTITMAKPQGVKLVIKNIEDSIEAINSGKTDKYKLFIVVESIKDAAAIANNVKSIKSINLGGVRPGKELRAISNAVCVSDDDAALLKNLMSDGVEVELRQVPTESKVNAAGLL